MSTDVVPHHGSGPHHDSGDHLHWETALDRLELDVMLAERMLTDPSRERRIDEPWDEPMLAGPIPPDLVERALAIRERQQIGRAHV